MEACCCQYCNGNVIVKDGGFLSEASKGACGTRLEQAGAELDQAGFGLYFDFLKIWLDKIDWLLKLQLVGACGLELALAKIITSVKVKMNSREKIGIAKIIHNIA